MGIIEDLLRLRFAAIPLQSMYLNADRVNERFIGHLGAITEWTRRAERGKGGEVDLKLIRGKADKRDADNITYSLDSPVAQALVLREALQGQGDLRSQDAATVGQYVVVSGRACMRNPELERSIPPEFVLHEGCPSIENATYQRMELDRGAAEAMRIALAGPEQVTDRMWLLTLTEGAEFQAASVLNSIWIDDAVISYMHHEWTMFGTVRNRIDDVPVLAAIHVWVTPPG
jgi:hypothetical protein